MGFFLLLSNRHSPSYFHDVKGEINELPAKKLNLKYLLRFLRVLGHSESWLGTRTEYLAGAGWGEQVAEKKESKW